MTSQTCILLLLAACAAPALGLQCFQCDSLSDAACGVHFTSSESRVKNCSGECVTVVFSHPDETTKGVVRGCNEFGDRTCSLLGAASMDKGAILETCASCDHQLCNSGPRLVTSSFSALVLAVLTSRVWGLVRQM